MSASTAAAKTFEPAIGQGETAITPHAQAGKAKTVYLYIHDAVPMGMPDRDGNTRFLLECYSVWDPKGRRFKETISQRCPIHVTWTGQLHRFHGDTGLSLGKVYAATALNVVTPMPGAHRNQAPSVELETTTLPVPRFNVPDFDAPCRISFQDVARHLPSVNRQIAIYRMIDRKRKSRVYEEPSRPKTWIIGGAAPQ